MTDVASYDEMYMKWLFETDGLTAEDLRTFKGSLHFAVSDGLFETGLKGSRKTRTAVQISNSGPANNEIQRQSENRPRWTFEFRVPVLKQQRLCVA
jgi:hypothetical protein